jgi:hypothetical protein
MRLSGTHQLTSTQGDFVPKPGEWPVDPQEDVDISDDRIWVDGCFDFAHHGPPQSSSIPEPLLILCRTCWSHAASATAGE